MREKKILAHKYSQWYPYINVHESYNDLSQAVELPRKICDYLIDAPKGEYIPPDDNTYARCRFWKYLMYDSAKPLSQPLPTIKQKLSVVFNPDKKDSATTAKGYRLYPQIWTKQSQTDAQTRVYVYEGRQVPNDSYKTATAIHFLIWTHYTSEANTKADAYSRTGAIAQALIEAFNGINMTGIGTFMFDKRCHPDCGSRPLYDGDINVGRELIIGLELATTTNKIPNDGANKLSLGDSNIKFW